MAPGQATLGKFFGNANGSKPIAQQSKLQFSSAATEQQGDAIDGGGATQHESSRRAKKAVDNGDNDMDTEVEETSVGKQNGRKRSVASATTDSDDEPPTKKARNKTAAVQPGSRTVIKPATTESSKAADGEASDALSSHNLSGPTSKVVSDSLDTAIKAVTNGDSSAAEDLAPSSAAESDDNVEHSDEEKEDAAKVRAKIQSTLKSTTKDPFPDWKPGEPVPYAALCITFSLIEMTTKRLEILAHCSLFLRQVLRLTPEDLLPTVLLMLGKLAADYAGVELGIGESLIMKSIGETTGRSLAIIKNDQQEIGDLGLVAAKSRSNQPTMFKPKPLTIRGVHKGLLEIATIEGQGAQGRKVAAIKKLLGSADIHATGKKGGIDITKDKGGPSESKFIVRTLEGKMRLGLAEKTLIVALAHAMIWHDVTKTGKKIPSQDDIAKAENIVKSVFNELPSYEVIIPAYLKDGLFKLREACTLQPGVPLKPMLARPTKSITEVLDRFEGKEFTCEYKYDGERAQIHFVAHSTKKEFATPVSAVGRNEKGVSNIFSRNSEDLSKKYPDILAKLPTWVKDGTTSFVLDCETVAWDITEKKVLPFQQLMTRKRKDVKVEDVKVKVCVFAFDLLYLNGEPLVNKSFRERREALQSAFVPVEGEFAFAQYNNASDLEEIQHFLEESMKASCEGLMVKMLDGEASYYEPSRRSQNWLKVKKDYLAGAGDSLDLVVIGAYHGKGKRTSWYGAFLLACYNKDAEVFETVCNIGTGFSEEMLKHLHEILTPISIDRPKPFYSHRAGNKDQPAVWFEPRFVWEVKTADLTLSPKYPAAADNVSDPSGQGKGVSLRFPRFIRERDDKKPEDATTSRQVGDMYRAQQVVGGGKKAAVDDDYEY